MRIFRPQLLLLIIMVSGLACTSDPTAAVEDLDDPEILNEEEVNISEDLVKFTHEATSDGMLEIEMAEMAMDRSENEQVKEFAEMIKEDHEKANERLEEIAEEMEFELPDEMLPKHEEILNRLSEFSDETFTEHYLKMTIKAHTKAVDKFKEVASVYTTSTDEPDSSREDEPHYAMRNVGHQEIQGWAEITLPLLRKHLQQSKELQKNLGHQQKEM